MRYLFTADLHLDHENIIKFSNRPFKNLEHMNESLIRNWNSRVKPDDYVFHIGDFMFKKTKHKVKDFVEQLNGKIIFIKGNHDGNNGVRTPILDVKIQYGGRAFLLVHRPEDVGYFGGYLALTGHHHGLYKFQHRNFFEHEFDVCNVGVDVWNYAPVTIQEILKEYEKWKREQ